MLATGVAESGTGANVAGASVGVAIVGAGTGVIVGAEDNAVLDGVTWVAVSAVGSAEPAIVVAVSGGNVDTPIPTTVVVVMAGRSEAAVAEVVVVCAVAPVATPRKERAESAPTMTRDFPTLLGRDSGEILKSDVARFVTRCAEGERWNMGVSNG